MRPLRRFLLVMAICLLPVVLLAAIGLGVIYVRLANGPVSLSFLKPAIERQIAAKLGGLNVDVSDVVLSLVAQTAAFRLTDVKVRDETGAVVAQAPLASMDIDRGALFRGQVVPTGITLIKPLMRLGYTEQGGLSLSFARTAERGAGFGTGSHGQSAQVAANAAARSPSTSSRRTEPGARVPDEGNASRITILRTLASLLSKVRSGAGGGNSLDKIGVRNAIIELDYGGRTSRWGVPSGDINIQHLANRSIVSGLTTIVEEQGRNIVLGFHAEASTETRQIQLRTSIRDLRSSAIARVAPAFSNLGWLDVPLSAEALFNLKDTGAVVDGMATIEVGAGLINLAPDEGLAPLQLDHGRIAVRFSNQSPIVTIAPSTIGWGGGNELTVIGQLAPAAADSAGKETWLFDLKSTRGRFINQQDSKTSQGVEEWAAVGQLVPADGRLLIKEAVVAVAGGRILLNGDMVGENADQFRIEGRLGPMTVQALSYLWPTLLAPDGRGWVARNITQGSVTDGRFSLKLDNAGAVREKSLLIRARNLEWASPLSNLPIVAERALVQIADDRLEVSIPTAQAQLAPSRSIALRRAQFVIPSLSVERPVGDLDLLLAGSLRDGATALSTSAWAGKIPNEIMDILQKRANGRIEGNLKAQLPLTESGNPTPRVSGQIEIKELQIKDIVGRHDVSGGTIKLDLAADTINARGEMLIAGVGTNAVWQYIKDAPLTNQPPVRLAFSLDEADRDKLGIKINHIVRGIVDVEVNLIPKSDGVFGARVRANATKAAIAVSSLAWVKPTGRLTQLEFDVVPGTKYPVLLSNLRVAGDGIAIQGQAMLDAKYNLQAFELPQFSIDRVTRLSMSGKLHKERVWRVAVKGQTFEGRALFRSLFNAGRAAAAPNVPADEQYGVDLQAEIETVLGFWNSKLNDVRMSLSKRAGKTQAMNLEGRLEEGRLLKAAVVRGAGQRRELHAFSNDAGKTFRLVGFYPNVHKGRLELVVNLDGQGAADKSGILLVRDFKILDDKVVRELANAPSSGIRRRRALRKRAQLQGQEIPFDWMRLPFFVGNGQFILQGAELRGPVVGATMEGKADFGAREIDLSGTYVPLQGLNGALGVIPGLGQFLAGPKGEGVLGMKFAVRGPMNQPEMLVNPLSMMAPGIFREMFQITNPSLQVSKPRQPAPGATNQAAPQQKRPGNWRRGAFGEGN